MEDHVKWGGRIRSDGYGMMSDGRYAHRAAYEEFFGPIPDGAVVDHECHNVDDSCPGGACHHRSCVNPSHLALKTRAQNVLSGKSNSAVNSRKVECKWGHPLDYVRPDGKGRGCGTCRRMRNNGINPSSDSRRADA